MIVFEIYKMSILFLSIFFIISAAFNEFISEKNKSDKEKNIFKNFKEIILKNKKKKKIFIFWFFLILAIWPFLTLWYLISIIKIILKLLTNKNITLEINVWEESLSIYSKSMEYITFKNLILNLYKIIKLVYNCISFFFIYKILKKDKINFVEIVNRIAFSIISGFSFTILNISDKLSENWEFQYIMIKNKIKNRKIKIKITYILKTIIRIIICSIFDNILKPISLSTTKKIKKEGWKIKLNGLKTYTGNGYSFFVQQHKIGLKKFRWHNCIYFKNINKIVWYTKNGGWLIKDDINGIVINKYKNNTKINQWMMIRNRKDTENIESLGVTESFIKNNDLDIKENYVAFITKAKIIALTHLVNNNDAFKYLIKQNKEEINTILTADKKDVKDLCLNSKYSWIRDIYINSIDEHYKLTENEIIYN